MLIDAHRGLPLKACRGRPWFLILLTKFFQENAKRISNQPVGSIIISDPITLSPDQDILLATTMMVEKMIRRLPVTENGIYLGSLSRADIVHFLMTL